jgi:predicted RND superfamily exporter protein
MLSRYTNWVIQQHKWIIFVSLIIVLGLSAGAKNLTSTNDFRVYFGKDNPQLVAFEELEQTYGKQDTLFFFIEPNDHNIFTRENLTLIWELTEKSWDLPNVRRVNSLTNYQHTAAKGDDLTTDYLLDSPSLLTPEKITSIKEIVLNEPTLIHFLTDTAGTITGIQARLDLPKNNNEATDQTVNAARALRADLKIKYPNIKISLGGSSVAGVSLGEAVTTDIETLISWSYIVIIIVLILLLRSFRGMLATILLVTFSTSVTMGIYGWFHYVLTPVAGWVPSIVMTIAVADTVHILISYFHGLRHGMERNDALRESMRININPVFITSLTTIIGVLCLNFSDSPPYRDLGNMVGLGVLVAYILSMTFLPALLAWFTIGKSHINRGESLWMTHLANWIIQQRTKLLITMSVLVVIVSSFITRNELTERWHEYFDTSFEIRNTTEAVNAKLTGVHYLRYLINSGKENGIHDPDYLKTLENFTNWLREQGQVAYVTSLTDISKRLNKSLHGDKPEWYTVPDSRELAAQSFLLYETGLPRELNLDDLVNYDRSASVVTISIHKTDSEFLLNLDQRARSWLNQHANHYKFNEATGLDMVFAHINHRNIRSLLKGTAVALVLISFVLIFALKSVRLGMISLIPNLIPAALAYGTWGYFIGKIDLSASIVICMSLGIVVDDTVHFLSKYLRARREKNYDVYDAMRYAFQTVGVALVITTAVLVAGFLVLVASPFSPTWVSGLLLAITLTYALLADFFFLPPLLTILDAKIYAKGSKDRPSQLE